MIYYHDLVKGQEIYKQINKANSLGEVPHHHNLQLFISRLLLGFNLSLSLVS